MAKSIKKPDPKPAKYATFVKNDKSGRSAREVKNAQSGSNGFFSGGEGPRVGTGVKRGTVKVSKPSSVSSGYAPPKRKKK